MLINKAVFAYLQINSSSDVSVFLQTGNLTNLCHGLVGLECYHFARGYHDSSTILSNAPPVAETNENLINVKLNPVSLMTRWEVEITGYCPSILSNQ